MYLNTLMEKKNISRAELSRRSCVPESTLRDILNGKARLDHCEALTVSCIAGVLGTTVEDLLINYWDEPLDEEENMVWPERHDDSSMLDFYMLVDSTMRKLSACGDMRFVKAICDDYWIERFYTAGFYRSAFFLLGWWITCVKSTTRSWYPGLMLIGWNAWTAPFIPCVPWKKATARKKMTKRRHILKPSLFLSWPGSISL